MAEVHKKGLNAELVMNDLGNCCRSTDVCGKCQQAACAIGTSTTNGAPHCPSPCYPPPEAWGLLQLSLQGKQLTFSTLPYKQKTLKTRSQFILD